MSDLRKVVEEHNAQPMYRANKAGQVMQRPVMTLNDNGAANTSMGFPICEVPEYVEPRQETAELIAGLLNGTDERAEMQAAIRELRELLDQHTDPMDRLPIIDRVLNSTKKWSDHDQ